MRNNFPKQHSMESKWRPPGEGMIKVNVDGAVFGDAGSGMGVVIRDHGGEVEVVRAGCQQVRHRWEASVVESKAMALGLKLAIQCNAKKVVVESDCELLVKLVNGELADGSFLGMLAREIRSIASFFDYVAFSHIFREANSVAHTLAHLSSLEYSTRVWVGSCPSVVDDAVALDFVFSINNN